MNAYITYYTLGAASPFSWVGVHTESRVLAFCACYGVVSAGIITLPVNIISTALTPDMRQFGTRFTLQVIYVGIGSLIENPTAGAIVDRSWVGLQLFAAATMIAAACFTIIARWALVGFDVRRKI